MRMKLASVVVGLVALVGIGGTAATVAPSAWAAGCPNEALRVGYSALLPECRAYEMVSPPEKNGGAVYSLGNAQAAPDGEGIAYLSSASFADAPASVLLNTYLARRADGWATDSPDAPQYNGDALGEITTTAYTPDLRKALVVSRLALAPGAIEGGTNVYVRDTTNGMLTLVVASPESTPYLSYVQGQHPFVGGSPDWSRLVLKSEFELDGEGVPFVNNLFEWANGSLKLISVLPDGEAVPAEVNQSGRPVSTNGERVFFRSLADNGLYMYDSALGTSIPVSAQQRSGEGQGTLGAVQPGTPTAAADGSVVYFVGSEGLAEGPAGNGTETLYRYDVGDGKLTEITEAPEGATEGAEVTGVLGASEDGSTVYFTARGGFAGAPYSGLGAAHVYAWTEGQGIRLVTTTEEGGGEGTGPIAARVSPDGSTLVLASYSLLTGDAKPSPNCPAGAGGNPEERCGNIFVYELGSGLLNCASCSAVELGESRLGGSNGTASGLTPVFSEYQPHSVLDDGTVFFETVNALSPRDSNDTFDVYEWTGGAAHLISSGTSGDPSLFADSAEEGRDVFVKTTQPLVSQDVDRRYDLYDARVDGGIAAQNPSPPPGPCEGETCRGASPPPPTVSPPSPRSEGRSCAGLAARAQGATREVNSLQRRVHRAKGKQAKQLRNRMAAARKRAKQLNGRTNSCRRQGR